MSQTTSQNQRPKASKKGKGAKNEANQFIYDKIDGLRKGAMMANNKNMFNCYAKILRSLEKCESPIVSAQQALQLDGVGPKMAALIGNIIKKRSNQPLENISFSSQMNSEDKLESDHFSIFPSSQISQFDCSLREEVDIREENSHEIPRKSVFVDLHSCIGSLKRKRDENDVFEIRSTLKKYNTTEDSKEKSFMEDDYTNISTSELWTSSDLPETSSSVLSTFTDKLTKAATTKKLRNYRPEKNSTGFNILISLLRFENGTKKKYASKKEIKETLKKESDLSSLQITNWAPMATLIKYDLISNMNLNDEEKFCLTESGYKVAVDCETQRLKSVEFSEGASTMMSSNSRDLSLMTNETHTNTIASAFNSDMTFEESRTLELSSRDSWKEIKMIEKPPSKSIFLKSKIDLGLQREKPIIIDEENDNQTINFTRFEKLSTEKTCPPKEKEVKENTGGFAHQVKKSSISSWNLVLYVDNREIRSQKERDYIFEKFQGNGVNCRLANLSLGDFLWTIELGDEKDKTNYVLDYIIERKTADDLASSILDRRYNQQKFRLINSNVRNIFYLVEGRTTQNAQLPQSTIDSAILNTQIVQNFKVRTTQSLQDTIRLITEMHQAIETKFMQELADLTDEYVYFRYKFDEYQTVGSKTQCLSTKILFGNMLRTIKGCGKEMVSQVLDHSDTLHQFYQTLKMLGGETERLEFLGICKKSKGAKASKGLSQEPKSMLHLNKPVATHIAKLFFDDPYPKIISKKANELNDDAA